MPLIRAVKTFGHGLPDITYEKEKMKILHVEDVEDLAQRCKEMRKDENNGFTKDRSLRLIARIPAITFFDKKHLVNQDGTVNQKEMRRYLKSPEGELFKTVDKGI